MSGRARKIAAGLVSALVVLGMLGYLLATPTSTVELGVTEVQGAIAYDDTVTADYALVAAARPKGSKRYRQTIYGVITSESGVPVTKARLVIAGKGKGLRKQRVRIPLRKVDTTFRSKVRLKPGRYKFTVRLVAGGRPQKVRAVVKVRNKRAYRVAVKVEQSGVTTMLPISSY